MPLPLRAYSFMTLIAICGLCCFCVLYVLRFETKRNLFPIGLLLVAMGWIFSSLMEVLAPAFPQKTAWYLCQFFCLICVPPLWLTVAGSISQVPRRRLTRIIAPAFALAAAMMLLFGTNPLHRLVFTDLFLSEDGLSVSKGIGPAYYAYLVYVVAGVSSGFLFILSSRKTVPLFSRPRNILVFAAVGLPLACGLLDIFFPEILGSLDLAPIAAVGSCVFLFFGTARWSLLNPLPLARSSFIEKLADPVLVLDAEGEILYANERANLLAAQIEASHGLGKVRNGLQFIKTAVLHLGNDRDASLGDRRYQAAVKPVSDSNGAEIARIVSLRDVTELRAFSDRLEAKVSERTRDLERLASDLAAEVENEKRQEDLLKRSLAEKELLFREVNHRVKNNLQVVSSLIRLQAARTADKEARLALESSLGRIQSISLVHQRLYGGSAGVGQVDAGEYLRDIVGTMASLYENTGRPVRVSVESDGILLGLDAAVNFGLIANEAATNAFKHVFGKELGGSLEMRLRREDGQVLFEVTDDGPGIPATESLGERGLGMSIIRTIVESMRGRMRALPGPGGRLVMEIPLSSCLAEAKGGQLGGA